MKPPNFFEKTFEKFFNKLFISVENPFSEQVQPVLFSDCGCKDRDKKITVQEFDKLFRTFFEYFLIFLKKRLLYLYILYKGNPYWNKSTIFLSHRLCMIKNHYLCQVKCCDYELEKDFDTFSAVDYSRPTS